MKFWATCGRAELRSTRALDIPGCIEMADEPGPDQMCHTYDSAVGMKGVAVFESHLKCQTWASGDENQAESVEGTNEKGSSTTF